jgi:Fes/CIP4, and EFC/F-BAR homology domain
MASPGSDSTPPGSTTTPRRQSSTTSLAKYIRTEPSLEQRSLDFCNAFWGHGDGGVEVLLARMRGAMRTVEEVRAFYKERIAIEEDYAKRLNKLAKMNVGKDEIG